MVEMTGGGGVGGGGGGGVEQAAIAASDTRDRRRRDRRVKDSGVCDGIMPRSCRALPLEEIRV